MKRYGVIIADPPWHYSRGRVQGAAEKHYPTMAYEDLAAMPVAELAAADSVLLLWATWPQLGQAWKLLPAWGFEYVTGFPWIKITGVNMTFSGEVEAWAQWGIGWWVRGVSEYVLVGRRGKAKPPKQDFVGLLSPNIRHSRKPDSLYEYAEAFPGPYLELFARRKRDGWDAWGNEVQDGIDWDTNNAYGPLPVTP